VTSADSASAAKTVLLVDDSPYWTDTIADGLRSDGFAVSVLHDGLRAIEQLRKSPPDILITDYFLADLDGGKLCQVAKALPTTPRITTIILTGGADRGQRRVPSLYADAVIAKNTVSIVFDDLRRVLSDIRKSVPPASGGNVIGHERLKPRVIATKLHGLKQYLDALHEGIGDAVIGVDHQFRVYFLSSVALDLLGVREEDALARPFGEVLRVPDGHELVRSLRECFEHGTSTRQPITVELGENTLRVTIAVLGSPDEPKAVVIARDITDLKAAEQARLAMDARMHQADKMASLGRLIASVSHEINNPLAAVLSNLRVLKDDVAVGKSARESGAAGPAFDTASEMPTIVEESIQAAERIQNIVAHMLLFVHPNDRRGEPTTVEALLEEHLSLVMNEVRFKATIERKYGKTPELIVDRTLLSQAFVNVILNAAQAIHGNDPSRHFIRIETRSTSDGVVVEISNSGLPIPKNVLSKIFQPFFTTKPVGDGVGLGLSIAYDVVRRHGGNIEAFSEPGSPTMFRIWLPLDTGLAPSSRSDAPEPSPTRPCRLLLIDDDRLVRNGLRRVLERHHDVEVAADGRRALELIEAQPFDVVVCDLIMPEMSGMELFETVRRSNPDQAARFVFVTGGTNSPEARDFLLNVPHPRVYKPVRAEDLVSVIARCLRQFADSK
jgi:two-component system, cell cycle sensor histidine kinase and response regulator CckA